MSDSSDDHLDTHPEHRDAARRAAERAALRAATGPILCSARALMTAEDKRLGAAQHGAIAVDMEGAPIAAEAARRHIPFVAVRAILDTADTELKHMGRFIEPHTGAVKPMALAGYLATHPGALADLLALQRMMRAAQTSLERFFTVWFSTLDS